METSFIDVSEETYARAAWTLSRAGKAAKCTPDPQIMTLRMGQLLKLLTEDEFIQDRDADSRGKIQLTGEEALARQELEDLFTEECG